MSVISTINFGSGYLETSFYQMPQLNLIKPASFTTIANDNATNALGRYFFYVDTNGDGVASYQDRVTRQSIDKLFNPEAVGLNADTTVNYSSRYQDIDGYRIVLPTIAELISLRSAYLISTPDGWFTPDGGNQFSYASADLYTTNSHKSFDFITGSTNQGATKIDDYDYVLFAVYIDLPTVSFSKISNSGAENSAGTVTISANLTTKYIEDIVIPIIYSGTATFGVDYTVSSSTITIPAGSLYGTLNISVSPDTSSEADESIVVGMSSTPNVILSENSTFTYNVLTDDIPAVNFSVPTLFSSENNGGSAGRFNYRAYVELTNVANQDVTVTANITGNTNFQDVGAAPWYKPTSDGYELQPYTVTIKAGQTKAYFSYTVINDNLVEADESLVLTISSVTNAVVGTHAEYTHVIKNDDSVYYAPLVGFDTRSGGKGGILGGGTEGLKDPKLVEIKVYLSAQDDYRPDVSGLDILVPVSYGGTASIGADYLPIDYSITIPADTRTGTLKFYVLSDTLTEDDESIVISIGNPTNAVLLRDFSTYTYTIHDLPYNISPTGSVTIIGSATQGQVLTASNTLADLDGLGTITYQWLANGLVISSATASTYTLTQSDVGKAISVKAIYTDLLGTDESVTSAPTDDVQALAQFTDPIESIDAIGLTPDGLYLIIKSNGVSRMVSVDDVLEFSDETTSALELMNTLEPTPLFVSLVGGETEYVLPEPFTGPESLNLDYVLIDTTPNAVVIGSTLNDFIALQGGGNKATDGGLGDDVIDGGVGSTFISGGGGSNTIFLDGRAEGVSWSTITDFKVDSDKATIWGWKPGVSQAVLMQELGGAEGYQGLTLHFENLLPSDAGSGDTNSNWNSITFSGKSASDFGFDSLETLNAQILAGTNPNFLTGQTVDDYGTHGYLFIS
jgi:hypothetical protein